MPKHTPAESLCWCLPRPSKSKYPGSFPLHFEKRLLRLYGEPELVLHPFGGKAEYGTRCDVVEETQPDVWADAHQLPFASGAFDFVIVDPPYSNDESKKLYGTKKLSPGKYSAEAARVCKPGGFIALYHKLLLPRPVGTVLHRRVVVVTRVYHLARICCVFYKYPCDHDVEGDCDSCMEEAVRNREASYA